jgi:hypothetical protein
VHEHQDYLLPVHFDWLPNISDCTGVLSGTQKNVSYEVQPTRNQDCAKMSEGSKICDMIRELLSNNVLSH